MMHPDQLKSVFAVAAGITGRTFGKADFIIWGRALDGLDPHQCMAAVEAHYSDPDTCSKYLVPGHVIGRVQQMRRAAGRDDHSARVFGEIEARREAFDPDAHHRGAAACRAAFDHAIAAKHAREDNETDEPEQAAS